MAKIQGSCRWLALFASAGLVLEVAADVVLSGETEYAVGQGETQTVSERITGAGLVRKTGAGTLVLANGGNDFTGGVTVEAGMVEATTAGALGSGDLTVAAASAGVTFRSASEIANALAFTGEKDVDYGYKVGNADGNVNALFCTDVRLTGDLTATRSFRLRQNPVSTANPTKGGPDTVFDGRIDAGEKGVFLNIFGTMTLNGPVMAGRLSGGDSWAGGGALTLMSSKNQIGELDICHNTVSCGAANVLGGATVVWRLAGGDLYAGLAHLNLNGFDQAVAGLSQYEGFASATWNAVWQGSSVVGARVGQGGTTYCVTSKTAATLTITGGAESLTTYAPIAGAVTLVLDAADYPSFVQAFARHASAFTGATVVRAGTLKFIDTAQFSGTTSLTVAAGGAIDALEATSSPFPNVLDAITLTAGASLRLSPGMVLRTRSLTVDGQTYTGRAFLFTPQNLSALAGGAIRVEGAANPTTAMWTGAASAALTASENWETAGALDLAFGSQDVLFAKAGTAATVDADAVVRRLAFRAAPGAAGFALNRSDPAHVLTVGEHLAACTNDAAATAHTYTIDTPLALADALTLHADTNQTLVLHSALNETDGERGAHTLTIDGTGAAASGFGAVTFAGTNVFGGALVVTTSLVRVSGVLANPGDAYTGSPANNGPDSINVNLRMGGAVNGGTYGLWLANATVGKSVWIDNVIGTYSITAAAGTTNEVSGFVRYSRNDAHEWMKVEADAELILSGGLQAVHSFRKSGPGTMRIRNVPVDCRRMSGFNPNEGRVVFEVPHNTFSNLVVGCWNNKHVVVETAVDFALTNGFVQVGGNGTDVGACVALPSGSYALDLQATTQRCQKVAVLKNGTLTGEFPARLEITEGWRAGDPEGYRSFSGQVVGGVGLHLCGPGTLTVTNALASCGDLEVSDGALELTGDGSWLNGTNVTVRGAGTLRLGAGRRRFGRKAVLHLGAAADSWALDIPSGAVWSVAAAFDAEGRKLSPGTYGNAASGAWDTRYAAHFPNGGVLRVRGGGLMLTIR